MPIQPIWPIFVVNGLDWQCCLAGSSKASPRILVSSTAIGANYSFEAKNVEICVSAFFKHNNYSVATVVFWVTTTSTMPTVNTMLCRLCYNPMLSDLVWSSIHIWNINKSDIYKFRDNFMIAPYHQLTSLYQTKPWTFYSLCQPECNGTAAAF